MTTASWQTYLFGYGDFDWAPCLDMNVYVWIREGDELPANY